MNEKHGVAWVSSVDERGRIAVRAVTAGHVLEVREELSGWSVRVRDPDGRSSEAAVEPTLPLAKERAVAALARESATL